MDTLSQPEGPITLWALSRGSDPERPKPHPPSPTRCRHPLRSPLKWPALLNILIATLIYLDWKVYATALQ